MTDHAWNTTVNDAVHIFRDALLAVIPMAERARMPWKEPEAYDDWDVVSEALYEAFVIYALRHAHEWKPPHRTAKYGFHVEDYSDLSFLGPLRQPTELAFVCLETRASPFDTVLFKRLDAAGKVVGEEREPLDGVYFVLSARSADSISVIDGITVE